MSQLFQSTRPHGARHTQAGGVCGALPVSIHAPARGATSSGRFPTCALMSFNPRARTGRDTGDRPPPETKTTFQSTRPHGARRYGLEGRTVNYLFQSTRPHGARRMDTHKLRGDYPFQSTRPHGARPGGTEWREVNMLFQSTRPHGARHSCLDGTGNREVFQSTRPHGARPVLPGKPAALIRVSIHAPARGATLTHSNISSFCFNPRARTGRDS